MPLWGFPFMGVAFTLSGAFFNSPLSGGLFLHLILGGLFLHLILGRLFPQPHLYAVDTLRIKSL